MAPVSLTQEERADVRFLLGFSMLTAERDPRTYEPYIPYGITEGQFVAEGNMRTVLDSYSYAHVQTLIARLLENRAFLHTASKTLLADKISGAVDLNEQRMQDLWAYDYQLCSQLATTLALKIMAHPGKHGSYGTLKIRS